MTVVYFIVLIAFIVTMIFLLRSIWLKYKEQYMLTNVSDNITDGYLIFTVTGKVTNYNKAILKAFKFNKNDIKNKNIYDIFNGKSFSVEDINKITDACKKIKYSSETIRFDIRNKNDDRIFKIEIKSLVNNDIFLRYVMMCKDVTKTYEMIAELQNNQDMMANREKFATLGQLISRNSSFFEISNFCIIWPITRG